MTTATTSTLIEIFTENLINRANGYFGSNIYQELFYLSSLVDTEATENAHPDTVVLKDGSTLKLNEDTRKWEHFD